MAMFTCLTCAVAFSDPELQRGHHKSDWHRYNLKRKVSELLPVSLGDFEARMAKHRLAAVAPTQPTTGYCVACRKSFATDKAYQNHIQSKKHIAVQKGFEQKADKVVIEKNRLNSGGHRANSATAEVDEDDDDDDDMEVEEVDSDEWDEESDDAIPPTDCLFCPHHSASVDKNVVHMSETHSFFIPDIEYLVDLHGLLEYLGAKVGQGHICLWCNERKKAFASLDALRKHMMDKGHAKMLHEGDALLEYEDFYDFSSSYPQADDNGPEAEVHVDQLDDDTFELVLPSGAKVGHRSLMRYYRQNLNPERSLVPHLGHHSKLIHHYKAVGWEGSSGSEAIRKAKDLRFMRQAQQKYWMKLGVKANRLQKHYRDPTM